MEVHEALAKIAAEAETGKMVFPTSAEMALRVQRALDDPDCSADRLGKLVQAEPLLAARVVAMANSVVYNRSGKAILDVHNAVARIGFKTLRILATSVAVGQLEGMSKVPAHRHLAARLWEHTAHVAALARVVAKHVTHQDPEEAFFAGIVHEVGGFYLISRADAHPGLLEGEHGSLADWNGDWETKVGHAVLQVLSVPEHVVRGIEGLWDGYLAMPPASLGDTLLLADQLAEVESPLSILAGYGREGMTPRIDVSLDDETLSGILAESAEEVESLTAALRS